VRLTEFGQHQTTNTAIYRRTSTKLSPNKKAQHNVRINKLFDMGKPGIYFITVKRKVYEFDGNSFSLFAETVSNTVAVTVTP
jgi:hypothetical protein